MDVMKTFEWLHPNTLRKLHYLAEVSHDVEYNKEHYTQECQHGLHQVIHHNDFPTDGFPSTHGTDNGFFLQKGFH